MIVQGYTYMSVIFEVILGDRYERNLYVDVALYGNIVSLIHGCLYPTQNQVNSL